MRLVVPTPIRYAKRASLRRDGSSGRIARDRRVRHPARGPTETEEEETEDMACREQVGEDAAEAVTS